MNLRHIPCYVLVGAGRSSPCFVTACTENDTTLGLGTTRACAYHACEEITRIANPTGPRLDDVQRSAIRTVRMRPVFGPRSIELGNIERLRVAANFTGRLSAAIADKTTQCGGQPTEQGRRAGSDMRPATPATRGTTATGSSGPVGRLNGDGTTTTSTKQVGRRRHEDLPKYVSFRSRPLVSRPLLVISEIVRLPGHIYLSP